jgi:ectoine hydroxylase-related dioxygenase (phytanoyl-CoA dioxygenase family)
MGPYIQFSMSQAIIRASTDTFPGYIHTDGGEAQKTIRVTETSRPLAVKVMYLLTDVTGPDSGNFTVMPGSHLRPFPDRESRIPGPKTPGTVPLLGKAGDAYVFPHAIWHGPQPNHSGKARKTILYNYCQMFMKPYDFGGPVKSLFDKCTPRQRRLLGDLGHDFRPGDFFYAPLDQEALMTGNA